MVASIAVAAACGGGSPSSAPGQGTAATSTTSGVGGGNESSGNESSGTAGGGTAGGTSDGGTGGAAATGGSSTAGTTGGAAGTATTGGTGSGGADASSGGTLGGSGGAVDGVPSEGCGMPTPASDRYTIDVDGTPREYILKVPDGYDPNRPYPLILAWHGRQYSAEWVSNGDPPQTGPYFGIESEANGGAVFVAPQALESGWTNQDGRDIAFVDAMLARFTGELCVDESRIFSTGFSFGAMMTITIGCARGDVFRAIAPMSGSLGTGCAEAEQPVAYWSSHGDADNTIPISSGEAARDEFVARNHCDMTTTPSEPSGCVTYDGCDTGYPVSWCVFSGAHEPPEFAGEAIWRFFSGLL